MDTKIFDYLKTKRAVFEIRHYLGGGDPLNDRVSMESPLTQKMEGEDFLTLLATCECLSCT